MAAAVLSVNMMPQHHNHQHLRLDMHNHDDHDHDMHDVDSAAPLFVPPHLAAFASSPASSSSSSLFRHHGPATPPPTPRTATDFDSAAVATAAAAVAAAAAGVVVVGADDADAAVVVSEPDTQPASLKRQASAELSLLASDPRKRYTLQKELHQSIFGKVYMGVDETSGHPVALKVSVRRLLDTHTSLNGVRVLENPVDEVKIMQQITGHRNVVNLVAVHEDADLHWMAQEFIGGGELFDALTAAPNGHFSEDQSRSIFAQILSGVEHTHAKGVAHLDLSLENMLVDLDGTIKICDFGLARFMQPGRKFRNNGENRPGKLGYMAPEVLSGEDFDGAKADVFSAGVVLFTMLTGHPPFEFASVKDKRFQMIARGHLYDMICMLGMSRRVSPSAADLLSRMLHPNPVRRLSVQDILSHPWMYP